MIEEDYADLIVFYYSNPTKLDKFMNSVIHYINPSFAVVHIPVSQFNQKSVSTFGYSSLPKLYGPTSELSLEASGVDQLRNIPRLNLRGEGILIGVIDSGIDYTNPVFLKSDGTTKVASLWDQTIESDVHPYNSPFGKEYRADQINQALASGNPYDIVPSRDESGHGTMMAAVAAGNEVPDADFSGIATDSELIVVKLRQAKAYLRDFYFVSNDITCYQENHIMWGIEYCLNVSRELQRPVVICLGIGTSQGSHDGRSPLARQVDLLSDFPGVIIITSVGNEGNLGRHYFAAIEPGVAYNSVELHVGEGESGFSMELWGSSPGIYSLDILTPNGEYISRIAPSLRLNREIRFTFENTIIYIDYQMTESETGDQLILLRFQNISAGNWTFNVYGQGNLPLSFHIWLPMGNMISNNTYFIQPNINTTVLDPSSATNPLAITAYNPSNSNLYVSSNRGYTRSNVIKPEIAAPGVNYIAPNQNQEFVNYTGTSVAAAHTAGVGALMLEWSIVKGNRPGLDTIGFKNYLIRGAVRNPNLTYPNRDWGYGILDVFNAFNTLRIDFRV